MPGTSQRSRVAAAAAAATVAAVALLAPAGPAAAQPYPQPYPETWLPDSALHTYCFTRNFADAAARYGGYAMAVLDNTTAMSVADHGVCRDDATDVWWWAMDLPGGIRGDAECVRWSRNICDSADIRLDLERIDIGDADDADREKTAVHEVGHTVGLGHHDDCAMSSGDIPSLDLRWRRYSALDVQLIDRQFGGRVAGRARGEG